MANFYVGQKVWLNQGDVYPCEILQLRPEIGKVQIKVKGWLGIHWYSIRQLEILHPVTQKPAVM